LKAVEIKKVGLVGWPVKHSISPALHNACFRYLKLPYEYGLYGIEPCNFDSEIQELKKNLAGFNVTVPHKERVMKYLDDIKGEASSIGAVNTVKREFGKWKGYNTDAAGFLISIKEDINPRGINAFVLGAGGAAKAVAAALAGSGVGKIYVKDIDVEKSKVLRTRIIKHFPATQVILADGFQALVNCGILVNATPVGMEDDSIPIPEEFLYNHLYVFDCVYNRKTPLIKKAERVGLKCRGGLNMLIYQASEAFKIWTGLTAPLEVMRKAAIEEMGG